MGRLGRLDHCRVGCLAASLSFRSHWDAQVTTKAIDLVLIFAVSGQIEGRRIARIMPWLIPTMILGALFAAQASAETLKIIAAGLILLGVFPAVWAWAAERTSYPVLGSLAGLFTTTSGFNGPPLALAL